MKTVKAFDWWRETEGNGASVRKAWDAAQANIPTKTCEWYYDDDGDLVGCKSIHSMMRAHCSDCGGKVTIKQTTEQKLEVMTRARDERDRMASNYLHKLTDARLKLEAMELERDEWKDAHETVDKLCQKYFSKREMAEQKLEAMTIERDRQRARANGALFDLRQAEKHLDELVNRAASTNTYADKALDMLNYIHKNELDK